MDGSLARRRYRARTLVLVPLVCAGLAAAAVFVALLLIAARQSDRVVAEREALLVERVAADQIRKVVNEQATVTQWDQSIINVKQRFDPDWIDSNLGIWVHNFFGVDEVFILDATGRPVYAMVDGRRVGPSAYEPADRGIAPLVARLRAEQDDSAAAPVAADLGEVDRRPAIVSVAAIVSDSGNMPQEPGSEFLHVSVRFLDGSYLTELARQYVLKAPRFAWRDDAGPTESAQPVRNAAGAAFGYLIWQPEMPGRLLLTRTGPALAGAMLAVIAVIAGLMFVLRRTWRELQEREAEVEHLAYHDPLTGLFNRAAFNTQLAATIALQGRIRGDAALFYLDLDGFKGVNDTFGHPAGDELIRQVSERLAALVRTGDTVARIGGDEFAILQGPGMKADQALIMAERLIEGIRKPISIEGTAVMVGVSIGVAFFPSDARTAPELVRSADRALYRAKLDGRNRVRLFADTFEALRPRGEGARDGAASDAPPLKLRG